jgi:hypothetical protein
MNILSYFDVEHYLTFNQVYLRKTIVDSDFNEIAKETVVYLVGMVRVKRINETTIMMEIEINGASPAIYQYMTDLEFFAWVKTTFVRVSEMYEAWMSS